MRPKLIQREDHLVGRHEKQLILELLILGGLLGSFGGSCRAHDASHITVGFNRASSAGRVVIIDPDYIEVAEAFGYLTQLILIFLVVEGCADRLYRLVTLSLSILWHEQGLICHGFGIDVIKGLSLDYLFLQEEVVIGGEGVVSVGLEAQLDLMLIDWRLFRRLHILDHILKYLYLVNADFYSLRQLFR